MQTSSLTYDEMTTRMGFVNRNRGDNLRRQIEQRGSNLKMSSLLKITTEALDKPLLTILGERDFYDGHTRPSITADRLQQNLNKVVRHELYTKHNNFTPLAMCERFGHSSTDLSHIYKGTMSATILRLAWAHVVFKVSYRDLIYGIIRDEHGKQIDTPASGNNNTKPNKKTLSPKALQAVANADERHKAIEQATSQQAAAKITPPMDTTPAPTVAENATVIEPQVVQPTVQQQPVATDSTITVAKSPDGASNINLTFNITIKFEN